VKLPLPLPGEIVSADMCPFGNEGAWESRRGGGWAIKNASYRKDASCRKNGDL